MGQILGVFLILFGILLIVTRDFSAELHEKVNRQFAWTRWATGPTAMRASRICNLVVGAGLVALGLVWLLGIMSFLA